MSCGNVFFNKTLEIEFYYYLIHCTLPRLAVHLVLQFSLKKESAEGNAELFISGNFYIFSFFIFSLFLFSTQSMKHDITIHTLCYILLTPKEYMNE